MKPSKTNSYTNVDNPCILVIYCSTGSGHKTAAESIVQELKNTIAKQELGEKYNGTKVEIVDILDFTIKKVNGNTALRVYSETFPAVFDFTWSKNFTGHVLWGGGNIWPNFPFKKFEKYVEKINPSCVICTHMMGSNVAAKARINLSMNYPIISVPTDYETEGMWPHKETDLFCVGSKNMVSTLIKRSVAKEKIILSGIPISKDYTQKYDTELVKKSFDLPVNKKLAVIMAGASNPNSYLRLRKEINRSLPFFAKIDWYQFLVCTGNDRGYKLFIERKVRKLEATNIKAIDYTNKMPELLAAADVVLGKAGGLSLTECCCSKTPIIIIGKTYAQERINTEYLTGAGAAYNAMNHEDIINFLCELSTNEKLYKNIMEGINKVRNPKASKTISDAALCLTGCTNIKSKADDAMKMFKKKNSGLYHKSIYLRKNLK